MRPRFAARQPTDIPKNEANKTTLVKNVRCSACAGNQRIPASSRKRISRLIRNNSKPAREVETCAEGMFCTAIPRFMEYGSSSKGRRSKMKAGLGYQKRELLRQLPATS